MAPGDRLLMLDLAACPRVEAMAFERALASALRDVMTELFFTNAGLLMDYINAGKVGIIEDIIASSAERSLKPGLLRYGRHALTHSDWGEAPQVSLDLELHHTALQVYFKIIFEADAVGVEIDSIVFRDPFAGPEECMARFSAALSDVRIPLA